MAKSVIEHRRALHSRAEVGFKLPKTRKYIHDSMKKAGYETHTIGRGSIIAAKRGRKNAYVLLRADMDALSIREKTALPFACPSGNMHACGHDMHTAMLLSTAERLISQQTECGVLFLFQAAEETLQGAGDVINSGLFDSINVVAAISLHVLTAIDIPVGTVIIPPVGIVAPGADVLRVSIRGKSGHGSTPHLGRSSIRAAIDLIQSIDRILLSEMPQGEPRVINWGKINGGISANIIAEQTVIECNFRYMDKAVRDYFFSRIVDICDACEIATGSQIETEVMGGCPPLINDNKLIELLSAELPSNVMNVTCANKLGGKRDALGGSEDFARFCKLFPSVMLSIAAGRPSDGYTHPLHTPNTDFDERALECGVSTLLSAFRAIEKSLPN